MRKLFNRAMIVLLFIPLLFIGIMEEVIGERERKRRPEMED